MGDQGGADIVFAFHVGDHGDIDFNGADGIAPPRVQTSAGCNDQYSGDVHFNDAYTWRVDSFNGLYDLDLEAYAAPRSVVPGN